MSKIMRMCGTFLCSVYSMVVYAAAVEQSMHQKVKKKSFSKRNALVLTSLATATAASSYYVYQSYQPIPATFVQQYSMPEEVDPLHEGIATLFVPGLGRTGADVRAFRGLLPGTLYGMDFADKGTIFLPHRGLAQSIEIEQVKQALYILGDKPEVKQIVLAGISCGAAVLVNLLKELDVPHKEKIIAVVAESPLARVHDVIQEIVEKWYVGWFPWSCDIGHGVVKCLYPYYSMAHQPIDDLESVTPELKKLPFLMLCSTSDKLIPYKSTERLAQSMEDVGFDNLRLRILHTGPHGALLRGVQGNQYRRLLKGFVADILKHA